MDNNRRRELWQVNKYPWMCLAFLLIYLPIAAAQHVFTAPIGAAWGVFGLALVDVASRTVIAYRHDGHLSTYWSWFYTYLDIVLITIAVAITGGIQSDLWLLYFVLMIFESLYVTALIKRLMDLNVTAAYLLATLPQQLHAASALPADVYGRIFATRLFFLITVSALGRRLSANAEARNRELLLLREQMAVAEERARIAREVHDSLGHALVSSILRLELCSRLISREPAEAEAILKAEVPALRAAWNEGRDLAFHLRPWEMDAAGEGGLADTFRRHIGRFAERTGLSVNLSIEGTDWRLRPEVAFGLTRIVQEALTNAARHAQPSVIEVRLARSAQGEIQCTIRDDGKGFDTAVGQTGVGLLAMRERAEALGGTLEVTSAPGAGTTVIAIIREQH
jgi:signal transduction histidine kinase